MDVFQFLKECRKQCCCDLICSVIIVTITWEVTFYNEVCCDSVFVTNSFNFCIFDSGQVVYYVREMCIRDSFILYKKDLITITGIEIFLYVV